jgi:hypothetical protein
MSGGAGGAMIGGAPGVLGTGLRAGFGFGFVPIRTTSGSPR